MKKIASKPLLAALLLCASCAAITHLRASILINSGGTFAYNQNFNTPTYATEVATAGTGNAIAWSWGNGTTYAGLTRQVVINGVNTTNKDYIGEFSSNTIRFGNMGNGGTFSTITSPTTDRALGSMMEGLVGTGNFASFGVVFEIGAGLKVTSAAVSYTGEQWFRTAAASNDRLDFQYKILNSYNSATYQIHNDTGWTDVNGLDFSALQTGTNQKLNGNVATNRSALSSVIPLVAEESQFIAFRWTNASDATAAQAALAVDDLNIQFTTESVGETTAPNFIVIVTDDQRWDSTSFMQGRMAALGRTARFPYLTDTSDPMNPVSTTPNFDRLSTEGIHFDNGFCVYSLCSPSRTVMLTGLYPHNSGVTYNDQEFPVGATTYATLLRDAGWATGYFGKWHHGVQGARPGFTTQRSFRGQGHHYNTVFYDENGTPTTSAKWVDEQSTDYVIDFINTQHSAGTPFVAFLGLKTPHGPRQDANGVSNAPAPFSSLFSGVEPTPVPNLLSQGASPPPWKPSANVTGLGNDTRNYMRLISAADAQVGRILDWLTALNIDEDTVVIFVSDNGYFLGEHGLGDKRAAYEESLRIPFMIRYPKLQPNGAGRIVSQMALNLDIAPTILDLAGLPIPAQMQGRSLKPLIENQTPSDWRDSFFFSYCDDPEFPGSTADFIGLRLENGQKLVRYALNSTWDEFYKTAPTGVGSDQYELTNLVTAPAETSAVAALQQRLYATSEEIGFLKPSNVTHGNPLRFEVQAGDTYPFLVKTSTGLNEWTTVSRFEGSGQMHKIDLVAPASILWDVTVQGDAADHALVAGNPVTVSNGSNTLGCGANADVGRNAVLIFALPALPSGQTLKLAQLEIKAKRNFAKFWDADLFALGIKGDTTPILAYHGMSNPPPLTGMSKIQDGFMDISLPDTATTVRSSLASGLSHYIRSFYEANPNYAGGQYLFLRINPEKLDMADEGNERFDIFAAGNTSGVAGPMLHLSFQSQTSDAKRFWRVEYGKE